VRLVADSKSQLYSGWQLAMGDGLNRGASLTKRRDYRGQNYVAAIFASTGPGGLQALVLRSFIAAICTVPSPAFDFRNQSAASVGPAKTEEFSSRWHCDRRTSSTTARQQLPIRTDMQTISQRPTTNAQRLAWHFWKLREASRGQF
jgi:hypothetical protein